MIVVFKQNTPEKAIEELSKSISSMGVQVNKVVGSEATILGIVGASCAYPSRIKKRTGSSIPIPR